MAQTVQPTVPADGRGFVDEFATHWMPFGEPIQETGIGRWVMAARAGAKSPAKTYLVFQPKGTY